MSNTASTPTHPWRDVFRAVLLGFIAGVLGLAPWLVTGALLPMQNLWATEAMDHLPLSLLPLNQYRLTTLVGLLTMGGAVAGLWVRLWAPARRRQITRCAAVGVLLVQSTAVLQSFAVLDGGLEPGITSRIYVVGLLAGVVASVAAGLVALLLLASTSPTRMALGAGLMAVPFSGWAGDWLFSMLGGPADAPTLVPLLLHWLPAAVVGVALAWCGFRPARRLWVWAVNLLLLWAVPALFISVRYVFGTRVYLGDFRETMLMGRDILAATLGANRGTGLLVLLTLAIGLAGAAALMMMRRRRTPTST